MTWKLLPRKIFQNYFNYAPKRSYSRVVVSSLSQHPEEAVEKLILENVKSPPSTSKLPKDAVIIKVSSVAVHWVDLLMMAGQYQHAPPLPYTPGMEYSGEVIDLNHENRGEIKIGDQVYVDGFSAGPRSYNKEYQHFGGMANYSVAPDKAVHKIPDGLNMHQAASFRGAYETSYHALVHCGKVSAGESVLIHGATGVTGLAATQICSALGANVIATGGSDEKLEHVREHGCLGSGQILNVHNYNSNSSLRDAVKECAPRGVDIVFDTVGGDKLGEESLRCLRFGGRYCVVGWTSTPFAAGGKGLGSEQSTANILPTNLIMMKGAQVMGCPVGIHTHHDPSIRGPRLDDLHTMLSNNLIKPHVSNVFPLEKVKEALMAKWTRKITGSCVLSCN